MAKRAGRPRNQLPMCYYEGYLEKRSFKDKTSRRLWTCLCGNTLFFFNEKRDIDYVEKLDLSGFISITDDNSQDRILESARLNLHMKDGDIKLTAPNAEARELWKGFIYSVAQLSVPSYLNLLPGQVHMLKEAVETEMERNKKKSATAVTDSSCYISVKADMPACYHSVSRLEAELLLEREAKKGNMLLRPGRDSDSFAVSTRQDHEGAVFKHYRVARRHDGGFIIDVDTPVPCATLHDVIRYLVEKTDGVLIPLSIEEPYEKNISFIRPDKENGEMSVQEAQLKVVPPIVPPKPVSSVVRTVEPVTDEDECFYLNDSLELEEEHTKDFSAAPPQVERKAPKTAPKTAIMPPIAAPRRLAPAMSTSSTNSSANSDPKIGTKTDPVKQIPLAAITELKLKLVQKTFKSQEEPLLV